MPSRPRPTRPARVSYDDTLVALAAWRWRGLSPDSVRSSSRVLGNRSHLLVQAASGPLAEQGPNPVAVAGECLRPAKVLLLVRPGPVEVDVDDLADPARLGAHHGDPLT